MSPLNDHRSSRQPVSHSHYTRKKRSDQHDPEQKKKAAKHSGSSQAGASRDNNVAADAVRRKSVKYNLLSSWLANHVWALVSTLGTLYRTPVSTLMTTVVIGIALALPAGLYIVLQNIQYLSSSWDKGTQVSLFLHQDVKQKDAQLLATQLRKHAEIENVEYISADAALDEFRKKSGFDQALEMLDENPLPTVLVIKMDKATPSKTEVAELLNELQGIDQVDFAQLDMQWLEKLNGLIDIGHRSILIVALSLGVAIFVIVSNTIRLTIQNRQQEIEVTKLIGGTDAFIQRPFLYAGMWYGVIGSLIAVILVWLALGLLENPVNRMATLYNSDYALIRLGAGDTITLILLGVLLSWTGSWFSVRRQLREIEPK